MHTRVLEEAVSFPLKLGPGATQATRLILLGQKPWHLVAEVLSNDAVALLHRACRLETSFSANADLIICNLKKAKGPGWVGLVIREPDQPHPLKVVLEGGADNALALNWLTKHADALGELFGRKMSFEEWGYDC